MTEQKFRRQLYFFYEKDSSFNSRTIHKSRFSIGQIWDENSVFAIQHIENRKSFTEVLPPPPPPPHDQANPFAYSC